jgi:para-aminobenzoate synthetase component 2
MVLVIDNYDSFVYNLSRYVEELGHPVYVARNNAITLEAIRIQKPSHIIISPGPCGPLEAGLSIAIVREFSGKIPILGVCLGHQVIGHVFGGAIQKARQPMHGKSSLIQHNGEGIFHDLPNPLSVGRYHSLIVHEAHLHEDIAITSRSPEGEVMSLSHKTWKLTGLQFHPESVLTQHGHTLLANFLKDS